jgi:probable rRNA maturation factor
MIEVEVADPAWTDALADAAGLTRQAAESAAALGEAGEIAVLLTSDETLEGLNTRFLGRRQPTNVLAFPDAAPDRLGDIALAYGVCAAEAAEQGKPLADHLRHLVAHGVLHLIGYDHTSESDAARMESIERDLLAGMNIPDPYAERAGAHVSQRS